MTEHRMDQGIQKLLKAEEDAKRLVDAALEAREKAQESMHEFVEEEVLKIEAQLQAEFDSNFGDAGVDRVREYEDKLKAEREKQLKEINEQYSKSKDIVIGLLSHKLGRIDVEVSDAIKQAMLTTAKNQ